MSCFHAFKGYFLHYETKKYQESTLFTIKLTLLNSTGTEMMQVGRAIIKHSISISRCGTIALALPVGQ
jgi:hypothetical protein